MWSFRGNKYDSKRIGIRIRFHWLSWDCFNNCDGGEVMCFQDQELELAKDIRELLAPRVIGKTGAELDSEEVAMLYHIVSDFIFRNDEPSVDMKLPFEVSLGANT